MRWDGKKGEELRKTKRKNRKREYKGESGRRDKAGGEKGEIGLHKQEQGIWEDVWEYKGAIRENKKEEEKKQE